MSTVIPRTFNNVEREAMKFFGAVALVYFVTAAIFAALAMNVDTPDSAPVYPAFAAIYALFGVVVLVVGTCTLAYFRFKRI